MPQIQSFCLCFSSSLFFQLTPTIPLIETLHCHYYDEELWRSLPEDLMSWLILKRMRSPFLVEMGRFGNGKQGSARLKGLHKQRKK